MIGIVFVMHGGMADEFLATTEHVLGPQKGMKAVGMSADHNREDIRANICSAADEVDGGDGVVVVTDLFGGSPANLCTKACSAGERRMIFGANVPTALALARFRHLPVDEAVERATEAGRKYINWKDFGQG